MREMADDIAANAPLSMQAAIAMINEAVRDAEDRDMALYDALVTGCMQSEDYKEGRTVIMEKRLPDLKGQGLSRVQRPIPNTR